MDVIKDLIFSGMQPSGVVTMGNYLGAIRNWVKMQQNMEAIFCIVDMHAITIYQDPNILRQNIRKIAAIYLACGIDIEKSHIFVQSHVSCHAELSWIFSCMTPLGWLNRMTQFKDKSGNNRENAYLGLYAYPVLQAADILLYNASHVPVGEDQKQHLEMTRDLAMSFNRLYGDTFVVPQPIIFEDTKRIMSLRDATKKMSKSDSSDYSRINMIDDDDLICLKIKKAKTDSYDNMIQDIDSRPEALNLLKIYAAFAEENIENVKNTFGNYSFAKFKMELSDLLVAKISPIRNKAIDLMQNIDYLDEILGKSARCVGEIAQNNISTVKEKIGFIKNRY